MDKKIALLFLTYNNPYHTDFWKLFLSGHDGKYSIYVHPKQKIVDKFWDQFHLEHTVETEWSNLISAEIALLKAALQDKANQKFVFLSETCLPLRPFSHIYEELTADDKGYCLYWDNPHRPRLSLQWLTNPYHLKMLLGMETKRYFTFLPRQHNKKNPQWIILNRTTAQLMTIDNKLLPKFIEIGKGSCNEEHYPACFLSYHGLLQYVHNNGKTFDDWTKCSNSGSNPYTFNIIDEQNFEILKAARKNGYLFARKFSANCELSPIKEFFNV